MILEHAAELTSSIMDMYDIIDICTLLQENSVEALYVVKHGCRGMGGRLRRKIVNIVAGLCNNTDVKVRRPAMEVALKIFEDLFAPRNAEPPHKRRKLTDKTLHNSVLLSGGDCPDADRVIECVSRGVTDADESIAAATRAGVADCLCATDMAVRLVECFTIAITIPATNKNDNMSVCVSAFLEMLFKHVRSQPSFQALKLSERPLRIRESTAGPSKLLTNSRTYHGTFLSVASRKIKKVKEPSTDCIDVEMSIDEILTTMIQFAKDKPDVAEALCLQVVKSVVGQRGRGEGGGGGGPLARALDDALDASPGDLTPLPLLVRRALLDHINTTPRSVLYQPL
ncbi:unnamed protein product [Diatraea saccharalis]|uniref:Uncharacterized protein n=1 Tax=Diatraea saccharalis TaxID=40085 RepID=A0A9N9R566_9NEOP|nr:unnamed protein product [Diatraea saccharalis]